MTPEEAREKLSRQLLWTSFGGVLGIVLCITMYSIGTANDNAPMRIAWAVGMLAVIAATSAGYGALFAQRKKLDAEEGQ